MQENSNKIIVRNSIVLYARLVVNTVCALLTTRLTLRALGVSDFGLFSVLGSIISFIGIINTIMLATSNRFIAVAIGKGNSLDANNTFNVNLIVHIVIAVITLVVAFPIGDWYVHRFINYEGDTRNAMMVFSFSIIGSIISFVGVPYNGLLMAKERFIIFSVTDIVVHILKLGIAVLIVFYFSQKLIIYAFSFSFLSATPTLVYFLYCNKHFKEVTKFNFVRDKNKYMEVFSFSAWISFGAIAVVGKSQGAAILVNGFFNTVMNTSLGIANSVNSLITIFAQNIATPIAPQITKSYASGNMKRCYDLLIMSTKFPFLLMFFVASPFLVNTEWILSLWLGQVPPLASNFVFLLIIDALIGSLDSGISTLIFAKGNIRLYQFVMNTVRLLAIFAAYHVLKAGGPAYSLLYAYIIFNVIAFVFCQIILHRVLSFDNMILFKGSYLPSLIVVVLFIPILYFRINVHPLLAIASAMSYLLALILFIGLSRRERIYLWGLFSPKYIVNKIEKFCRH